jgi:L-threonylcarbamoyladenylate synthase
VIRIRVSASAVGESDLAPAIRAIAEGGVVGFPTETFYGLAADPRSAEAVGKVFAIKRRPPDMALPLIAASLEQVAECVGTLTPLARRLALRGWPGPLTLIIPASSSLCDAVHLSTGKIAVRVPGHAVSRGLAAAAGHALTSTSANISGEPPSSSADVVAEALGGMLDVLIDAGPTPGGEPSTIVDATGRAPVLVRPGAIAWERVLEFSSE